MIVCLFMSEFIENIDFNLALDVHRAIFGEYLASWHIGKLLRGSMEFYGLMMGFTCIIFLDCNQELV